MINSIPLSWYRSRKLFIDLRSIPLPLSKFDWVYTGGVPFGSGFEEIYEELSSRFGDRFLVRGCSPEIAAFLKGEGSGAVATGSEAVITLQGWKPGASLRELCRRGLRHGWITEADSSSDNLKRLDALRSRTPYGSKPFLKYLFRTGLDDDMRCFVHSGGDGRWLGAVTVSKTAHASAHVETMLRSRATPAALWRRFSSMRYARSAGTDTGSSASARCRSFFRRKVQNPSRKGSSSALGISSASPTITRASSVLRTSSALPGGLCTCAGGATFHSGRSRTCL